MKAVRIHDYGGPEVLHVEIGDTASLPRLLSNLGGQLHKMRRPLDACVYSKRV